MLNERIVDQWNIAGVEVSHRESFWFTLPESTMTPGRAAVMISRCLTFIPTNALAI